MGVCRHIKVLVHAVKTVELLSLSEQEVMASLEVPVEWAWFLPESADKHLAVVVASALVEPTLTALPVWLLTPHVESMTSEIRGSIILYMVLKRARFGRKWAWLA